MFNKNNYNRDFSRHSTHRNFEPNATNTNATPRSLLQPYLTSKGLLNLSHESYVQPYNIHVAHKPITTLRQLMMNVKDKDEPSDRQGAVYKIKCCDSQATYIGETGRNLNVQLTEHKRATRNGDINNHIADHHLKTNHRINWDSAECVTYSADDYQRITLESWPFTNCNKHHPTVASSYLHLTDDWLPTTTRQTNNRQTDLFD